MPPFLLNLVKGLGIKEGVIGVLVIALIACATEWHTSSLQAKNIKTVYLHPEVKTVEHVVYKQGPVQIKTVIVKEPSGAETTTITEDHAPITQDVVSSSDTTPIPISVVMHEVRTDRYLLTVGTNRLTLDPDGKALFIGYGFKNRLDVQVGGMEHNGWSPWVLATFRF